MIKVIRDIFIDKPEFLTSQNLVDLGLYTSIDSVYLARVKGPSAPFIKMKRKILYPKKLLIEFLEGRFELGNKD